LTAISECSWLTAISECSWLTAISNCSWFCNRISRRKVTRDKT
jgi:hypothetical protein